MIPGVAVILYISFNFLFKVDREILFQEMMHDEVGMFVLGGYLDW